MASSAMCAREFLHRFIPRPDEHRNPASVAHSVEEVRLLARRAPRSSLDLARHEDSDALSHHVGRYEPGLPADQVRAAPCQSEANKPAVDVVQRAHLIAEYSHASLCKRDTDGGEDGGFRHWRRADGSDIPEDQQEAIGKNPGAGS